MIEPNVDLGSKKHNQSRVLIESNLLIFPANRYDNLYLRVVAPGGSETVAAGEESEGCHGRAGRFLSKSKFRKRHSVKICYFRCRIRMTFILTLK